MGFEFKPFEEMTAADYADIGLKCGLEIHQQLLTRRKLFCRCPAGRYSDDYDAEILRHMRPTLSELGEYDGTALMEKKTEKNIYYRIHRDTVCTYEMDDTPPFFMDPEALDIGLEIGLLLNLNMVSELHIARKQYLDGSIPTGFQRTTILGVDGWIPYKDKKIGIIQLGLEEDACREVSDVGHDRIYLTDRLGMPLVETVTYPDMRTPQETAEVAQIIRRLCRSTGKVRTGYGAAREDVNVSVEGGTRIEIKGVPQITRIPRLIHNEAMRQCALLNIRRRLHERGVTTATFEHSAHDVTRIVSNTQYEPIRAALAQGLRVKCVVLKRFGGLLNHVTQEHTTFAKEFSDRVRVIACLTKLPNIVHSDTASESLSAGRWQQLRKKLRAGYEDALVLVWGDEKDTDSACREIALRAREATEGIPNDTRQALKDGTNGFERVLPGPDRMYPDTDLPPLRIEESRMERIQAGRPEFVWEREARYRRLGLPDEIAQRLSISGRAGLFDRLTDELGIEPMFAAVILVARMKQFERVFGDTSVLTDRDIYETFRTHHEGRLAREGVSKVLAYILERRQWDALHKDAEELTEDPTVQEAMDSLGLEPVSDAELNARIDQLLDELDDAAFACRDRKHRYIMGCLLREWLGRVEARTASRLISEKLEAGQVPATS